MTQEEKQLLLVDLSARLPYKVKLDFYSSATNEHIVCTLLGINPEDNKPVVAKVDCGNFLFPQEHIKPYLRPMSSMTEPEKKELEDICTMYNGDPNSSYEYFGVEIFNISRYGTNFELDYTAIDWLNAHHFDYRGLIGEGLALEAPKDMYK